MAYAVVVWDEGNEWLGFSPDAKRDLRAAKKLLSTSLGTNQDRAVLVR